MPALYSYSSSPSDTLLDLVPTHGCMEQRYFLQAFQLKIDTDDLQIFPTQIRAKGISICASAGAIGSIVVGQFFPVAIQNIGSKTYFIFFCINVSCVVVCTCILLGEASTNIRYQILATVYPETKGKSLEEMDTIFGKSGFESRQIHDHDHDHDDHVVEEQIESNQAKI